MTLRWIRLDTALPRNPKLLALLEGKDGHRAAFVFVCSLAYAGEQGTDGYIPKEALAQIHGRPVDANRLVDIRLWVPDPGGWLIHDWPEFHLTTEETKARTQRARAAALARWEANGTPTTHA